jgi:hypothetical protein
MKIENLLIIIRYAEWIRHGKFIISNIETELVCH